MKKEKAGNDKKDSRTCTTETIHVKALIIYNLNFALRESWINEKRTEIKGHSEFNVEWQNAVKNLIIKCPWLVSSHCLDSVLWYLLPACEETVYAHTHVLIYVLFTALCLYWFLQASLQAKISISIIWPYLPLCQFLTNPHFPIILVCHLTFLSDK